MQGIAENAEAEARREAAIEHAQIGLDYLIDYLQLSGLGMNALANRVGDVEIRYDEARQKAVITRTDGEPMSLFFPSGFLIGILPLPPELNITVLSCEGGNLAGISCFPETLKEINCPRNCLTALPALPGGLTTLRCWDNLLSSMPDLPNGLITLDCKGNSLASLGSLPPSLKYLYCANNEFSDDEKQAILEQLPDATVHI